jgi:hypothetical protein
MALPIPANWPSSPVSALLIFRYIIQARMELASIGFVGGIAGHRGKFGDWDRWARIPGAFSSMQPGGRSARQGLFENSLLTRHRQHLAAARDDWHFSVVHLNAVPASTWYYLWADDTSTFGKVRICTLPKGGTVPPALEPAGFPRPHWRMEPPMVDPNMERSGYGPWSAGMSFTVAASLPGKAVLLSPSGAIGTSTPTYIWNAVPGATWYLLWVSDGFAGPKIQAWYTAAQAGCGSASRTLP